MNELEAVDKIIDSFVAAENKRLMAEVERLQANIARLLQLVGARPAVCSGCKANVVWVRYSSGKSAMHNHDGSSHFSTCPFAKDFRHKHGAA